jgi:hypothetical protein
VMRYLVQHHGIELRQVRAIAMGKEALATGEKPGPDAFAKARRVDLRLLTPWSSWEDNLSLIEPQGSSTVTSMQPPQRAPIDVPARGGLPEFLETITPNDLGGN